MKLKEHLLQSVLLATAFSLPVCSVFAAAISGTVSDMEGDSVAGAQIIARQPETAFSQTVVTSEDGSFSFDSLPPGTYTITVTKTGFADLIQEKVAAGNEGEPVQLDLQLRSSSEQTVVEGEEELNPNVFVVKLDTNEIQRQLKRRGARIPLIREFRSQENYYGATYGYPLREIEYARPRALLQGFHGTLYESHQNSAWNARSFFTVGKLKPWRRNQLGATAGGPLFSDKLSFNSAWSQLWDVGFVNGNIRVPLPKERIPLSSDPEIREMIAALLEGYPAEEPNLCPPTASSRTCRDLNTNAIRDIRSSAFSSRLDYRPRDGDRLIFEQRFLDYTQKPFEMVAGQNPVTFLRPQSYHLTYNHTFSPSTVFRLSYNFDRLAALLDVTERYKNLLAPLGIAVVPDIGVGGDISRLGPGASFPRRRVENRFHVSPEWTQIRGNHTISAGFALTRFQINDLIGEKSRGAFSFSRNRPEGGEGPPRPAIDNFRLGLPTSLEISLGDPYRGFRNWEHAFYLHDTVRVRPSLTLSLGLRYEIVTSPIEVNNLTSISFGTDANNFSPQFGFAWNPGGGKTALRGGYGISFGTIFPLLYSRERFNPPAIRTLSVNSPDLLDPLTGLEESKRAERKLNSPDLVAPYTHAYRFAIQRQLPGDTSLTVGYIGERTIKLPVRILSNRAEPVPGICTERAGIDYLWCQTSTINQRRSDPRFLQVTTVVNGSIAYFDALQVAVVQRLRAGLTWNARYSFSKAISTADTTFADISSGAVSQSAEIISDLRGVAKFDTPHALTIGYSYELPGAGTGIQSLLLGGWRVSGTTTFRSGTPISIHTGSDSPVFGNVDGVSSPDRPNLLNPAILGKSLDHPDTVASVLGVDSCKPVPLENPSFFQCEHFDTNLPPGGRGNLGYNTFRNDGTHNWNFALEKQFYLPKAGGGEPQLQLRAEFINFLNQPQFSPVNNRIAAEDTFGTITNTANRGRTIQFTLRLRM